MKDTTARDLAQMFLQEMANEHGTTQEEINAQMPWAQTTVANLLFENPDMPEEELTFRFTQAYINAF